MKTSRILLLSLVAIALAVFALTIGDAYAHGQGAAAAGPPVIINQSGAPVPSVLVTICTTDPGTGTCSVRVPTFTSITLGTACSGTLQLLNNSGSPGVGSGCSNPGFSDGLGNVIVYAAAGAYFCQYSGTSITTYSQPCPFPGTISGGATGGPFVGTSTFPAAVTTLKAYGDSITADFGVPPGQGWEAIFARAINLPITNNLAVAGARLYQTGFYPSALLASPSNSVGSILLGNSNELVDVPANTSAVVAGDMALTVFLALPNSQVKQLINSAVALGGGGWTVSNAFGQANNVGFSTTAGNTATATVTGTTVYIGAYVAAGYGTGTVTVDGVSQGSISFLGAVAAGAVYPVCFRFPGFSAGSHTVVLTVSSGFNSIQWMAGNGTVGPFVSFGNTIPRTAFTTQPGVLNSAVQTMLTNLATDGLNVKYIDDNAVMTLTTAQYQSDLIHPNSYGHTLIAGKWLDTFGAGSQTLGQLVADSFAHIQGLPFGLTGSAGWQTQPVFTTVGFNVAGTSNPTQPNSQITHPDNGILLLSDQVGTSPNTWMAGGGNKTIQGGNGGSALNTGIATTTLTTITDGTTPWTFGYVATTLPHTYNFWCDIEYQASAVTTALVLGVNSSSSTGASTLSNNAHIATSTNGVTYTENYQNSTPTGGTSITTLTGAVAATANANLYARIWGTIEVTTAGANLSMQAAASPSGTVLIMRGSGCNGNVVK